MMVTYLFDILTKFFILILITINIGVVCQVLDNHVRYVAKDEDFTLKCQNKTDGRFAQLIWTSNTYNAQGKEMIISYDSFKNENVRINYRNRIKRINGTSIQIRQAKQGDDGTYECNIIYTYAPSKTRIRMMAVYKVIVVSAPVNIVVESGLVSVKEGESLSIYCEVQSLSPFNITWYKWDGPMTAQVSFYEDSTKVKNYYIKRKTLKVKNMTIADKGKYKCVASNLGGELFKYSYLKIKSLPVILSEDKSYVSLNKDALLKCEARGYPTIKFKWRLLLESENITLNALERYRRYHIVNAVYDSKNEIGTSVLLIKSAKKEDFHFYSCIAINSYGSSQKDIELIRVGAPDAPWITVNKLKSFPTEIYMFWNFGHNGGYLISAVTIQYRNDSFAKWTNIKLQRSLTSYALTDLIPGTMYEIRIAATNVAGQSEFSRSVKISTRSIAVRNDETSAENIGEDSDLAPIIGIFAGVFVALVAICLFAGIFVKKMKKSDNIRYTDSHNSNNFGSMPNQTSEMDGSPMLMEPLAPPADEWEFPRDRLNITTVLGQGAFGIVMRGSAQGIKGSLGQIQVAVKMVRDSKNEAATQDLLAELNLLKLIPEHPNVVGLLGCCTRHEPYYVIVEYCTYGDLQGFLRSSRGIYERYYRTSYGGAVPDLTSKMLLTFAWQIAKGMAHLAGMKVIHRDLAARNILVDDQLVCKVSDFGFARDIYVEEHYLKRSAGGRFPIKWMAIESLLDGLSTTKSDVWAYGVVLWELVTLGASPYPGMNSYEVVSFLQDGYRMDKPKHCSDDVYNVMVRCWNGSPGRRPSFGELADLCEKLVESSSTTEYISMNFYQDHLYINFDVNDNHNTPQSTLKRLGGSHGSWTSTLASLPQSESEISLQEMHCMPPLPPLRTHSSASAHAISSARIENGRGGHARPKRALRNQDNDLRRTNSESVARSTESSSLLSVRE